MASQGRRPRMRLGHPFRRQVAHRGKDVTVLWAPQYQLKLFQYCQDQVPSPLWFVLEPSCRKSCTRILRVRTKGFYHLPFLALINTPHSERKKKPFSSHLTSFLWGMRIPLFIDASLHISPTESMNKSTGGNAKHL